MHFVCDTLRMSISGGVPAFDLDQMMEMDMDVHHHEASVPVAALTTVADALPGLGIVAAVLGVVITMGALGGPPEEIGAQSGGGAGGNVPGNFAVLRLPGSAGVEPAKDQRCRERIICAACARASSRL